MISLLLIPAAFVVIQDTTQPPQPPPPTLGSVRDRKPQGALRERMRQGLMKRMQKNLNLTDSQVASMEKKLEAREREVKGFNDKIRALQPKIQGIMKGAGSTEEKNAKLKPLVDEWFALRYQRDTVSREQYEQNFRAGLDPMQQMRLTLGMESLRDEMKNRLRDRLQPRPPGMDGPGMGRGMSPKGSRLRKDW
jgi:hypothetical protein